MTRWGGDNVVPLHRGQRAERDEAPIGRQELIEAACAFATLERYIAELGSGAIGLPGKGRSPILRLRVHWPATERWLDRLGRISVATWPDTTWALEWRSAHALAVELQRTVTDSLYRGRVDTILPPASLVDDALDFAAALRELRELITQRYPNERPAH